MSRPAPGTHRLPQRLDYNLIPAPLDLSLMQVTEKSSLPAIIVTPSSPSVDTPQFYIAFLNPPPKPSLRERISQYSPFHSTFPVKARTALLVALLLFILTCHLFVHLAGHRPHFDFYKSPDHHSFQADSPVSGSSPWSWSFNFRSLFEPSVASEGARNYIVEELSHGSHR